MDQEQENKTNIAILFERNKNVNEKLDEIRDNHLKHMAIDIQLLSNELKTLGERLGKTDRRIAYYSGGIAVITIVVTIFSKILFK